MRHAIVFSSLLPLLVGATDAAFVQDTAVGLRAEIVRLDVVVTGGDGKPVRDLQRDDFQILEDGKPQTLTQFAVVSRPVPPTPGTPAAPDKAPAAPGPAEPLGGPGRYVVIFVDDIHIAPGHLDFAKEALRRFAAEFLGPDDRAAVITSSGPEGTQALTGDQAVLEAAIGRLAVRQSNTAPALGSQMTPAQAELVLRGDPNALQLATRLIADEPGSVVSGQTPQAAVEGGGGYNPASVLDPRDRGAAQEVRRQARAILAQELRFSEITLARIEDVLRSLAPLPGRKVCLLVSDGFLVGAGTSEEQTRHLRAVLDAATRSGAVVYALDTHGLTSAGGDSSTAGAPAPPGLRERVERLSAQEVRETLTDIANDTGGFLVRGPSELDSGLRRMREDGDVYYLAAYEPTNSKRDGKFRKIDVRLPRRAGLVVRTRRGYLAPDDRKRPERLAATRPTVGPVAAPALDEAEVRTALASPIPPNGTPVRLVVDYLDLPPAGSQIIVGAHVSLAGLAWREAEGRRRADLDLVGGVYDANGGPAGPPFGKRFALDLTPAEQKRALKTGLLYQNRLLLGPGRFDVRLIAREPGRAPLGGALQSVEIPDVGTGGARSQQRLPVDGGLDGDPRRWRRRGAPRRADAPAVQGQRQPLLPAVRLQRPRGRRGRERRRAPGPDPVGRQADRGFEAPAGRPGAEGRGASAPEQRNEPGGTELRALRPADRGRGPQGQRDRPPGRGLHRGVRGGPIRVRAA